MNKPITALAVVTVLAACDGNPFADTTSSTTTTTPPPPTTGTPGISSPRTLPPGTATPTPNTGVVRYEARDTTNGNGYAESVSYDGANDRFYVDNLAFDGNNFYERDNVVGQLGPFAVYENNNPVLDTVNGQAISQLTHKAIYGVSTSGNTEFAIIRTGAYFNYGFGGFVYQRNNDVTLETTGQAIYNGKYAGLRDYEGFGGLEYVEGDIFIAIDFEDFNNGDSAVRGEVLNRVIYDLNGNDVTATVLSQISTDRGIAIAGLPVMRFVIEPGVLDANGELIGSINSYLPEASGGSSEHEAGSYFAVVSGTGAAQEIVGVIVVESPFGTGTSRETGGFIAYR